MGHGAPVDSMIKDGLWDVYNDFHMGTAAELCAKKFAVSRQEQDEFAAPVTSGLKLLNATEILPRRSYLSSPLSGTIKNTW